MIRTIFSLMLILALGFTATTSLASEEQMSIEDFTKLAANRSVKISPNGKYLSVVIRKEGHDVLAILNSETLKYVSAFQPRENKDINEVHWVNDERLVYSLARSHAYDKRRYSTGELVGVNIDGTGHELVFGYSAGTMTTGTRIKKKKKASYGSHEIIDLLEDDEEHILITFYPWRQGGDAWHYDDEAIPRIVKLNIYKGTQKIIEELPLKNSRAIVDNNGAVRFAVGVNDLNEIEISFKKQSDSKWQNFSSADFEGNSLSPKSFSEDNSKVYLSANIGDGTRALYLFDLETKKFEKLFHDEKVDITQFVYDFDGRRIIAVATELKKPSYQYLDASDKKSNLHKMLMESFEGFDIYITSSTKDKKLVVVYAYSDFNPGDYYLFDTEKLNAEFLFTSRPQIDISRTASLKPIELSMRDGKNIFGYLTLPKNENENLPLVVFPHGGPHGIRDYWGFDWEAQLLASRGYAVLQVNYRGSGGFGKAFEKAGYGEWGGLMQDDITDATKAMIKRGVADADRICIFGASYGAYAALMGSIREPDLYKCAIGSAGVYNLPMMFKEGDIAEKERGLVYLKEVLGENIADQKARSPVYNVDKIKASLLLIHGKKDERTPIEQVESLKAALDRIDKPYQMLEFGNEGHGYYDEGNRLKTYTKVLEFLDENIGRKMVKTAKN